ncbi:DUF2442 domain-containing protein [Mesobacillus subterraneus]|uniref:DUF2442 domain-containing protein n=1 Tax=Mesobacillus subterraneus TaxID=285983 RepID=A0A0D6Z7V4_9BACI|nr:DUF2442 domain-containing protein [Mesobacillus subterraneus]KIY21415.1 hypothetical protein UB32_13805 [Mesobacillus subterraneus]
MRVKSIFTGTFKIILAFDNGEYRLLDIKQFLQNDNMGKLAEIRDEIDMFRTATIDENSGTVAWKNGVDFDNEILFQSSTYLGKVIGHGAEGTIDSVERYEAEKGLRDTEEYKMGYWEGHENGLFQAIKIIVAGANDEERKRLAVSFMSDLPFPKIIEHFHLSFTQAKILVQQVEFAEYEKDEFDSYIEEDGFFDLDAMKRMYQYRLKHAKRDIEDTPPKEIISSSKILSMDLKKLLIEYIKEQGEGRK